jgi:hypothetical protein
MPVRQGEWFRRRLWISIAVLVVFMSPRAGRTDDSAFESWIDITTIYQFADRWHYDGDQGIRGVISGDGFTLLYLRPSVRYRVYDWFMVHGGVRFFRTDFEDDLDTFEVGPWQGLRFIWPRFKGYAVSHYLRLEERMIWSANGESGFDFTLRSRYQLGFRTPNFDVLFPNGIYLTGSLEVFWDLEDGFGENLLNRIRWDLGAGTNISKNWRVELHGISQDGGEIDLDPFSSDEKILRVRLFYRFN